MEVNDWSFIAYFNQTGLHQRIWIASDTVSKYVKRGQKLKIPVARGRGCGSVEELLLSI
jgi:hypothetical protein